MFSKTPSTASARRVGSATRGAVAAARAQIGGRRGRWLTATVAAGLVVFSGAELATATTPATPIQTTGPAPSLPSFIGKAAKSDPVMGVQTAWQDPFMAKNPGNSVHNDAWQSDNYTQWGGPLGRHPQVFSTGIGRDCITLSFDRKGNLISTCSDLPDGPGLYLLNSHTLATLAFKQLPYIKPPAGTDPATNTTGGAYFYLDNHGRVVLAASNHHILVIKETDTAGRPGFKQVADYNPGACLSTGDRIPSVLPDEQGRLWFVGRYEGAVGTLNPQTGKCHSVILHEQIENSFAVANDGTYVVTDKAMYKFAAGKSGEPKQIWRVRYDNIGKQKPGQINAGSGTTPTLIGSGHGSTPAYVAIADNGEQLHVDVYRTASKLSHGEKRTVCTVPVFKRGFGADENSLVSMDNSLIAENNYGYVLQKFNDVIPDGPGKPLIPVGGNLGLVSQPGMDRIDINRDGDGCHVAWRNNTIRTPSAVTKGDTVNGLIYTYQKVKDPGSPGSGVWYWTAINYRTGKTVWMRRSGYGGLYNNHYSGIAIARDPVTGKPTLYLGGVGGIVGLRDS